MCVSVIEKEKVKAHSGSPALVFTHHPSMAGASDREEVTRTAPSQIGYGPGRGRLGEGDVCRKL